MQATLLQPMCCPSFFPLVNWLADCVAPVKLTCCPSFSLFFNIYFSAMAE